jgi:hypothetical protein
MYPPNEKLNFYTIFTDIKTLSSTSFETNCTLFEIYTRCNAFKYAYSSQKLHLLMHVLGGNNQNQNLGKEKYTYKGNYKFIFKKKI